MTRLPDRPKGASGCRVPTKWTGRIYAQANPAETAFLQQIRSLSGVAVLNKLSATIGAGIYFNSFLQPMVAVSAIPISNAHLKSG